MALEERLENERRILALQSLDSNAKKAHMFMYAAEKLQESTDDLVCWMERYELPIERFCAGRASSAHAISESMLEKSHLHYSGSGITVPHY